MENQYMQIANSAAIFFLVFARMSGLFIVSPIFGRRNLPTYYKFGVTFFLSIILLNVVMVGKVDEVQNIYVYSAVVAKEFIVGLVIGYIANAIFSAIYLGGQLIDMQMGFGMVNILDPISNIQVAITSQFYLIATMLIFMLYGGHHILIEALFQSYQYIPIGKAVFENNLMENILRIFGNIFVISFKIAAPVIGAILLLDIAIGIVARTVPQFNIFVVGLPLKILLGLIVLIFSMPMYINISETLIKYMDSEVFQLIKNLGGQK